MRGSTIDILLVEDSPGDAKQFQSFLKGDFAVSVARTGAEALDKMFRRGKFAGEPVPDLVVLDLNLPLLSGLEVLNTVRNNSQISHIPVVVWSGSARQEDISRAYEMGCCAYMIKRDSLEDNEALLSAFSQFWLEKIVFPQRRTSAGTVS